LAVLTFIVLEGFSGTGKTTLATKLEQRGWLRLMESAHALPSEIPVADRANTFADYSLVGATMQYSYPIYSARGRKHIVAEGYFISDLTYAMIRQKLNKSSAFQSLFNLVRAMLAEPQLQPDLYLLLKARGNTIDNRQSEKNDRERNISRYFRVEYYKIIGRLHQQLQQQKVEIVETDSNLAETLKAVESLVRRHGLAWH
jgi:thymidylate kinase